MMKLIVPRYILVQYFSAIAASLGGFCIGTALAWSSGINYLQPPSENVQEFHLEKKDVPLAASVLNLGAMLFAVPSEKLADLLGRTPTLLFTSVLFLTNWILIAFTGNVTIIMIARFVGGMAMGGVSVVSTMYISEIADIKSRFTLSSFFGICIAFGLVFMNTITLFCSWQEYHLLPAIFPLLFAFCFLIMPESPSFFVSKGKITNARKCLRLLRSEKEVEIELSRLQDIHHVHKEDIYKSIKSVFKNRSYLHALTVGIGIVSFLQLSNINSFNFYGNLIFEKAEIMLEPTVATAITNLFQVIVLLAAIYLKQSRRKILLIVSATTMALTHLCLGIYFHLKENNTTFPYMPYLPLASLVVYVIGFCSGFGALSNHLTIELLVPAVRRIASGIIITDCWFMCFLVTYCFPLMLEQLGNHRTFYIFSVFSGIALLFIWKVVPETNCRMFIYSVN